MTSTSLARPAVGWRRLAHRVDAARFAWLARPLLVFLLVRVLMSVSAFLGEIAIPGISGEGLWRRLPDNVWLDVWARFDSGFYLRIAEEGYWFTPGEQSGVAFFPLYPLLISVLAPALGSLASGVLISNLFLLGALILLYRLTEFELDAASATRTILYIAIFPTAFFFSAVYTESAFLFFAVGAMYFTRRHMWAWAGLFGLLCASTRIVGVVIAGVIVLEWLLSHGLTRVVFRSRRALRELLAALWSDRLSLLSIGMVPLGLLSYMVFLGVRFDDPVAFSTVQSAWGRELLGPVELIARDLDLLLEGDWLAGDVWWHVVLDVGAFLAALLLAVPVWRRLGVSYALFMVVSILIPSTSGTGSLSRYVLVLFPAFMLLGFWGRRPWLDRVLLVSFATLLGVLTTISVNWIFVA